MRNTSNHIKKFLHKIEKNFHGTLDYFERQLLKITTFIRTKRLRTVYNHLWGLDNFANDETSNTWTVPITGLATFLLFEARFGTLFETDRGNFQSITITEDSK